MHQSLHAYYTAMKGLVMPFFLVLLSSSPFALRWLGHMMPYTKAHPIRPHFITPAKEVWERATKCNITGRAIIPGPFTVFNAPCTDTYIHPLTSHSEPCHTLFSPTERSLYLDVIIPPLPPLPSGKVFFATLLSPLIPAAIQPLLAPWQTTETFLPALIVVSPFWKATFGLCISFPSASKWPYFQCHPKLSWMEVKLESHFNCWLWSGKHCTVD